MGGSTDGVLVTGAAGFVGYHVAERLLASGRPVIGIDNLNDYYDPALKAARLALLEGRPGFVFQRLDIADREATAELFANQRPAEVIHLAAQAGCGTRSRTRTPMSMPTSSASATCSKAAAGPAAGT